MKSLIFCIVHKIIHTRSIYCQSNCICINISIIFLFCVCCNTSHQSQQSVETFFLQFYIQFIARCTLTRSEHHCKSLKIKIFFSPRKKSWQSLKKIVQNILWWFTVCSFIYIFILCIVYSWNKFRLTCKKLYSME